MRLKSKRAEPTRTAFTLLELLLVIVILTLLVGMLLPGSRAKPRAPLVKCMSNLKQVALASILYATDEGDRFPWSNGKSQTNEFSTTITDCFEPLRPHAGTKVFVCPTDSKHFPTTNGLQSTNLSYFINLSSRMNGTNQVLAGDRHLATNGVAAGPGRIVLVPPVPVFWTHELHPSGSKSGRGVLVFVDGHAEAFIGYPKTTHAFDQSGLAEQTLLIP